MATSREEEEFVLLDLDSVSGQLHIPPNAPYVLSVCTLDYKIYTFSIMKTLLFFFFFFK